MFILNNLYYIYNKIQILIYKLIIISYYIDTTFIGDVMVFRLYVFII